MVVEYESNKRTLWEMSGCDEIVQGKSYPAVGWGYPSEFDNLEMSDHLKNKIAHNLNGAPLPYLDERQKLWEELCEMDYSILPFISQETKDEANKFLEGLPKPVVLFAPVGNTWKSRKDLSSDLTLDIQEGLVERGCSVVILDWDNRVGQLQHPRVRNIKTWDKIHQKQLAALMDASDLLISVDTGSLHFSRLTNIPSLGLWPSLLPCRCGLPSRKAKNLVPVDQLRHWNARQALWGLLYYEGSMTAEHVCNAAESMLKPSVSQPATGRYLYKRVNHDERVLELLPDGTIGLGAAGCESVWTVTVDDKLVIAGAEPTCVLQRQGEGWVGAWLKHEKMPIELVPVDETSLGARYLSVIAEGDWEASSWVKRYETLYDVVKKLNPKTIVEIGVRAGYSSWTMFQACPDATIFGIDADFDPGKENSHGGFKGAWANAVKINAGSKFYLTIVNSHHLDRLPACDLAYIDGDHDYSGVKQDIQLAARSAKAILLDDYATRDLGIKAAVIEFMAEHPTLHGEFIDNQSTGLYLITGL